MQSRRSVYPNGRQQRSASHQTEADYGTEIPNSVLQYPENPPDVHHFPLPPAAAAAPLTSFKVLTVAPTPANSPSSCIQPRMVENTKSSMRSAQLMPPPWPPVSTERTCQHAMAATCQTQLCKVLCLTLQGLLSSVAMGITNGQDKIAESQHNRPARRQDHSHCCRRSTWVSQIGHGSSRSCAPPHGWWHRRCGTLCVGMSSTTWCPRACRPGILQRTMHMSEMSWQKVLGAGFLQHDDQNVQGMLS